VLQLGITGNRSWAELADTPIQLYADARGQPPRLAAVLICDGRISYTDWEPDADLLGFFRARKDNQIMALELLALALGLSTFGAQCRERRVRLFSDNVGAERCTKKGSAREWDHTALIHSIWLKAARLQAQLWVERVPTAENIADLPSRESYSLLQRLGAVFVEPMLDPVFRRPDAWEALSLRSLF
jgi:hypothetical protein